MFSSIQRFAHFFSTHPLSRGSPMAAWGRFLGWQVRSRLQPEIIYPWIEGQRLAVQRSMTGATGNIYVGLHEFVDMMLPLHFLREGDLFLDIGSNVGSYTVLASGVRKATTWAFEPDPSALSALRRNVALNALQDRVVVHEIALGDTDGEVAFTRGLDTVNRVAAETDTNVRTVAVKKLDSIVGTSLPSIIKMDVEGYEERVLRGAKTTLSADSLKVVELETTTGEIAATLQANGFVRAYYDPFQRLLTRTANDLPASNAVFVRDWDFVVARLRDAPQVKVLGRSI